MGVTKHASIAPLQECLTCAPRCGGAQESHNLAPTQPALLEQLVHAFEDYQKTAVDDISCTKGIVDPKADPQLRPDQTWGPFLGSTECKYV